jgi:hypothetical protein
MLKEGDQLVKVDGVLVKDEHEAQQMLQVSRYRAANAATYTAQQMLQVHTCTYLRYI